MTEAQLKIFEEAIYLLLHALTPLHSEVKIKIVVDKGTKTMIDARAAMSRFEHSLFSLSLGQSVSVTRICGIEITTDKNDDDKKNP